MCSFFKRCRIAKSNRQKLPNRQKPICRIVFAESTWIPETSLLGIKPITQIRDTLIHKNGTKKSSPVRQMAVVEVSKNLHV